jgi:hypothetical protein
MTLVGLTGNRRGTEGRADFTYFRKANEQVCSHSRRSSYRPARDQPGFVENDWIRHTVAVGDQVRLRGHRPLPSLRDDRTAVGEPTDGRPHPAYRAQHNHMNVGVYADVIAGGAIVARSRYARLIRDDSPRSVHLDRQMALSGPGEARELIRGANVFRLPQTHRDPIRALLQVRSSPSDSLRPSQTPCS